MYVRLAFSALLLPSHCDRLNEDLLSRTECKGHLLRGLESFRNTSKKAGQGEPTSWRPQQERMPIPCTPSSAADVLVAAVAVGVLRPLGVTGRAKLPDHLILHRARGQALSAVTVSPRLCLALHAIPCGQLNEIGM